MESLGDVAENIFIVEQTRQPPESENAAFERRFANRHRNPFLRWNPPQSTIRTYRLSEVVLDGELRDLLNRNGFIQGTGYLLPANFLETISIDNEHLVKMDCATTAFVGRNVGHGN